METELPTLDELSDALEGFTIKAFREIIGSLVLSLDFVDFNGTVADVTPKEMPLHQKILVSVGDSLFGGQDIREPRSVVS